MPLTFQTFSPGCTKGDPDSWQAFLASYMPIVFRLLEAYSPQMDSAARGAFWKKSLAALAADDFKRLREFDQQAEREFLVDLKAFVLECVLQDQGIGTGPSVISSEAVQNHLAGRPIAHQEILWLSWGGYSPAALEKVLVVPRSLVAKALETPAGQPAFSPAASGMVEWLKFVRDVRAARTEHCAPRRIFVRIMDGQISWYDKTPAEKHMAGCLTCLESWASLREADSLRRETSPLSAAQVAEYMELLPLTKSPARGSWFSKLLGR
jgi:hypothetical protein